MANKKVWTRTSYHMGNSTKMFFLQPKLKKMLLMFEWKIRNSDCQTKAVLVHTIIQRYKALFWKEYWALLHEEVSLTVYLIYIYIYIYIIYYYLHIKINLCLCK